MDHLDVDRAVLVERLLRRLAGADLRIPAPGPCAGRGGHRAVGPRQHATACADRRDPAAALRRRAADRTTAGMKYNRNYWLQDWPAFVDFFFGELCVEPHSTKLFEDVVEWRSGDAPARYRSPSAEAPAYAETAEQAEQMLRDHPVPGPRDQWDRRTACQPQGRFDTVARLTGAERLFSREPATCRWAATRSWSTGRSRPSSTGHAGTRAATRVDARHAPASPRVLYLSSPIGLGHVRRDLAIADALREQHPDVEVEWLTQSPVTDFLEQRGETVHPASAHLASESTHIESESGEHDLHAFQAIRRMDEVLVNNFMVFDDLVVAGELRPLGRRRGLGPRPLPAREPRAQAGAVRVDDRLRGLDADGRRWRAGGVPRRGLQRRDGRARCAVPLAAGPLGLRRRPGRRRRCARWVRTCRTCASGPRSTSSSPAT